METNVLTFEAVLLENILKRNEAQHRHTHYFRALKGVVSQLKYLDPDTLPVLVYSSSNIQIPHALDSALSTISLCVQNIRRASQSLKQQMSAGYFLPLVVALLAVLARIIVSIRHSALTILCRRRLYPTLSTINSRTRIEIEWLVGFGNSLVMVDVDKCIGDTAPTQTANSVDDFGETMAFAPDSHRLASVTSREQPLLAADYSASDEDEPVTAKQSDMASSWGIDTRISELDFFQEKQRATTAIEGMSDSHIRPMNSKKRSQASSLYVDSFVLVGEALTSRPSSIAKNSKTNVRSIKRSSSLKSGKSPHSEKKTENIAENSTQLDDIDNIFCGL
jgi:hypothetical protein